MTISCSASHVATDQPRRHKGMMTTALETSQRSGQRISIDTRSADLIARCCGRKFLDSTGLWWTVQELPYPASLGPPGLSLVFECIYGARRVRRYSPDWRTLSDTALESLGCQV
jgi:hypothetical protein